MASGNPQPAGHQTVQEQRYDSVSRVKALVWSVKESVVKVVKVAADEIFRNAAVDNGLKTSEDASPRMDKCLEDFFSLCNQIELNLRTIQECSTQLRESQIYLPLPVTVVAREGVNPNEGLSYGQYLATVKGQVAFAKAIQEVLLDGARKVTQADPPPPGPPTA